MSTRKGLHGTAYTKLMTEQSLREIRTLRPPRQPVLPSQATLEARALYEQARLDPRRAQRQAAVQAAFEQASQAINARIVRHEKGGRPSKRMPPLNVERRREP